MVSTGTEMKILITGAAGYFGSLLTHRLSQEGHQIRVVDNLMFGGEGLLGFSNEIEVLVADIRNKKLMQRAVRGREAVIHLAALVGEPACQDEQLAQSINFEATQQLIDLAQKAGVKRFLFASSCSIYGPASVYAKTKLEAEKIVLSAASPKFSSVVLRQATLFGLSPRMRFNLLLNEIARSIVFGEEILIYNPDSWRPFVSLEDTAKVYSLLLNLPGKKISGQIFNVVGENVQKKQLVKFIKTKWPKTMIRIEKKAGERDYKANSRKLKRLGWQAKDKIKPGLVAMVVKIKAGFLANPYDPLTESWLERKKLEPKKTAQAIPLITPTVGLAEEKELVQTIRSTWITEADKTIQFEKAFAQFTGARFAAAVPNGTLALTVALMALELPKGSQVIIPDMTMAGTPDSVILAGMIPVLADVSSNDGNLIITRLEALINKKTKVIMPVHFNGRPVAMDKLLKLACKYGLKIIEDAAQGLGCFYLKKHLGTLADLGCFSLSTAKILTTAQGGMVVTDNQNLYEKILRLKDHGRLRARQVDYHDQIGFNFKFTDLQSALGLAQMKGLPVRMRRKKEIYRHYQKNLRFLKPVSFPYTDLRTTTPWLVEIRVKDRDGLVDFLNKNKIGARRIYPALHHQPAFRNFRQASDLSGADKVAASGLWLPSGTDLENKQVQFICRKIKEFYQ